MDILTIFKNLCSKCHQPKQEILVDSICFNCREELAFKKCLKNINNFYEVFEYEEGNIKLKSRNKD